MRKILLIAASLLMTISMMAIGKNDGSTKANAIDFKWTSGHTHEAGATLYYRVGLSELKKEQDPTLSLYLTNLSEGVAKVTLNLRAELMGEKADKQYSYEILSGEHKIWQVRELSVPVLGSATLKNLMDLGLDAVYIELSSTEQIKMTANAVETEEIIDDACTKAVPLDLTKGATVPAGEKWFYVNLMNVKNSENQLNFVVKNNGAGEANVSFDLSLDCPATYMIENDWKVASGSEATTALGRVFLDFMKHDFVYLRLTNDQPIALSVEEVKAPVVENFDENAMRFLELDVQHNLTGAHVFEAYLEDLIAKSGYVTEYTIVNNNDAPANLKLEMAFSLPVKGVIEENYVIDANSTVVLPVNDNLFKALNSEMAYIRYTTDKDLTLSVSQRKNTPCVNSIPFDWTTGVKQEAGKTQWYEMDITSLVNNKQHLQFTLKNLSKELSLVNLELALDCDGEIIPVSLPVPANLNISQVIDYQILARSPRNRVYVGVTTTNAAIELATSVKNYIADDQAPCQAAVEVELGKEYEHTPGTQWYKLSLDLLKSKVKNSSVYFANKNNQRAHITFGLVTDCMYATGTTITVPVPAGLELGATMPNVVGNLLEALEQFANAYNKVDAKDLYLEVTTDLPIHFGLDVENAATNPCLRSDLIPFDWDKGAKVEAGKAAWYDMDLTVIKKTGKHVNLKFTNPTDSTVWATAVVSLDCPAKVTVPVVVPVPANLSIEHVVDYSLFAAVNVEHVYVGVSADGPLELTASTIDATASTVDCSNVIAVESGDTIQQAASTTQLYQVPLSLLDQEGRVAKLTFANQSKQTAVIKAGFTVDCKYGISTYGTIKVPQDINMSLNIPRRVIKEARRLLAADITDIYLQVTSSQPIAFIVDMQATDTRICEEAEVFDWQAWEKNGVQLTANDDLWYKVDFRYLLDNLKNGEDLAVTVTNNDTVDVNVDVTLSPSCPMLVSYNKLITIPAKKSVTRDLTYDEVIALINRYDKFVYDAEKDQFFTKYYTYAIFNKLTDLLGRYAKFVPFGQIEILLERYGEFLTITGLHELLTNYETYLSVEELKGLLAPHKEHVSYQDLIDAIDAYGKYIPSAKAQELLEKYGDNIPTLGAYVLPMIQKCEKYITNENLKKAIEHLKGYVPFEEMKELFNKIEQYLPTDAGCFVRVKVSGDLGFDPVIPEYVLVNDTVNFYTCDGDWYTNEYTDETVFVDGEVIVLTVQDTIHVSEYLDTIRTYVVNPILAFDGDTATLAAIPGATPTFTIGQTPDVTGTIDAIANYIKTDLPNVSNMIEGTAEWYFYDTINDNTVALDYAPVVTCSDVVYPMMLVFEDSCENLVSDTLYFSLTPFEPTYHDVQNVTKCGSYTWANGNGETYNESKVVEHEVYDQTTGCLTDVYTLNLTINKPTTSLLDTTLCVGADFTGFVWNDSTYLTSGTDTYRSENAAGCDSIATLKLTINKITTSLLDTTLCVGADFAGFEWNGQTYTESDTVTYTTTNAAGCDSIVTLNLTIYNTSLPEVTENDLLAVCGEAVNVEAANSIINAHIAAADYAPNASVDWFQLNGTEWGELRTTAIDGTLEEITVKYAVTTDCGVEESDTYTLTVEPPTSENNPTYDNIPLVAKYGGRILLVDLVYIYNNFGWDDVAEEDVEWYQVAGDVDNLADDIYLHDGYAHNEEDGSLIQAGQYYARIAHAAVDAADCAGELKTTIESLTAAQSAPQLLPNMARPNETMRLVNLDATTISTVKVVSTTGELLNTIQVNYESEILLNAAQQPGFYIVEVSNANGKSSLRYIVK